MQRCKATSTTPHHSAKHRADDAHAHAKPGHADACVYLASHTEPWSLNIYVGCDVPAVRSMPDVSAKPDASYLARLASSDSRSYAAFNACN